MVAEARFELADIIILMYFRMYVINERVICCLKKGRKFVEVIFFSLLSFESNGLELEEEELPLY